MSSMKGRGSKSPVGGSNWVSLADSSVIEESSFSATSAQKLCCATVTVDPDRKIVKATYSDRVDTIGTIQPAWLEPIRPPRAASMLGSPITNSRAKTRSPLLIPWGGGEIRTCERGGRRHDGCPVERQWLIRVPPEFPRTTKALHRSAFVHQNFWSGRRDSNSRPSPWQGDALPPSYFRPVRHPW
jgi:hypothetical protein